MTIMLDLGYIRVTVKVPASVVAMVIYLMT